MIKNKSGFAVLETLLILVIIAIIGGTGWFVWHSKQQTDKTLENTSGASQSAPSTSKKPVAESTKAGSGLDIKEWGVKASYSENSTLIYNITSPQSGNEWAQLTSKEVFDREPNCDASSQMAGVIIRQRAGTDLLNPDGTDSGVAIDSAAKDGTLSVYSKVGDYYYWYQTPQAACGDIDMSYQTQAKAAAEDVTQHLEAD